MKVNKSVLRVGILASVLALGSQGASASSLDPGVLDPSSLFAGKTQYEWSADWWTTFLNAPAADNPISTPTNVTSLQDLNNSSRPLFYLTGAFGPMTAPRSVTVPSDKAIFFPVVNVFWTEPQLHPNTNPGFTPDPVNMCSAIQSSPGLPPSDYTTTQTLDGRNLVADITLYRQSCTGQANSAALAVYPSAGGFVVNTPPVPDPATNPNLIQSFAKPGTIPDPSIDPPYPLPYYDPITLVEPWNTVSDGYWLLLDPLAPGRHEIRFTATRTATGELFQDATYIINSVPAPAPLPVLGVGAALGWSRRLRRRLGVNGASRPGAS